MFMFLLLSGLALVTAQAMGDEITTTEFWALGETSGFSTSSHCWMLVLEERIPSVHTQEKDSTKFCERLTPSQHKELSLAMAGCHLADMDVPLFQDDQCLEEGELVDCLPNLTRMGATVYTQFYTHVHAWCLRLTEQVWLAHERQTYKNWKQDYQIAVEGTLQKFVKASSQQTLALNELQDVSRSLQDEWQKEWPRVILGEMKSAMMKDMGSMLAKELDRHVGGQVQALLADIRSQHEEQAQDQWQRMQTQYEEGNRQRMEAWVVDDVRRQREWKEWQSEALEHQSASLQAGQDFIRQVSDTLQPFVKLRKAVSGLSVAYQMCRHCVNTTFMEVFGLFFLTCWSCRARWSLRFVCLLLALLLRSMYYCWSPGHYLAVEDVEGADGLIFRGLLLAISFKRYFQLDRPDGSHENEDTEVIQSPMATSTQPQILHPPHQSPIPFYYAIPPSVPPPHTIPHQHVAAPPPVHQQYGSSYPRSTNGWQQVPTVSPVVTVMSTPPAGGQINAPRHVFEAGTPSPTNATPDSEKVATAEIPKPSVEATCENQQQKRKRSDNDDDLEEEDEGRPAKRMQQNSEEY